MTRVLSNHTGDFTSLNLLTDAKCVVFVHMKSNIWGSVSPFQLNVRSGHVLNAALSFHLKRQFFLSVLFPDVFASCCNLSHMPPEVTWQRR